MLTIYGVNHSYQFSGIIAYQLTLEGARQAAEEFMAKQKYQTWKKHPDRDLWTSDAGVVSIKPIEVGP